MFRFFNSCLPTGADRALEISKIDNSEDGTIIANRVKTIAVHDAPVLSIDVHPIHQNLILSADMAGKVSLMLQVVLVHHVEMRNKIETYRYWSFED
jgi:hypothetical protein